ncbi:DUF1996 domain-containing protein [Actinoplanes sp. NPDC051851]|uniref:DUF1996 domain-containing protein n=1 Tax=Actinoplanes sp. NPDC051851 TaxID=3154753 RepID=UPI00342ED708
MRESIRLLSWLAACAVAVSTTLSVAGAPAEAAAHQLWKIDCGYSHSAPDDPIVFPGRPGASHLHDFLGNASTNAYSTYDSMNGVTSTCVAGDRAAYWAPTLYRNGTAVHPDGAVVYYSVTAYDEEHIEAFPADFKMIVGDKSATTAAEAAAAPGRIYWGCHDNSQIDYVREEPPANCTGSIGIQLRVEFPSCWDGVPVSGNAVAHMRFPSGGDCPAGFPHAFPRIGFHATYDFGGPDTGEITFSSGNVYSIHLDFWNTWDQKILQTLIDDCSNAGDVSECGHFTAENTGSEGTPGKPVPAITSASSAPRATKTTKSVTASPSVGPAVTATTSAPASTTPTPNETTSAPSPSSSAGTRHVKERAWYCLWLWRCRSTLVTAAVDTSTTPAGHRSWRCLWLWHCA